MGHNSWTVSLQCHSVNFRRKLLCWRRINFCIHYPKPYDSDIQRPTSVSTQSEQAHSTGAVNASVTPQRWLLAPILGASSKPLQVWSVAGQVPSATAGKWLGPCACKGMCKGAILKTSTLWNVQQVSAVLAAEMAKCLLIAVTPFTPWCSCMATSSSHSHAFLVQN
jgi:hypothetical protein